MPVQTERPTLGGRYRLEEPIGFGGMGRVFRATDELLDRPVAVKLLERRGTADMPELAEARAAARLSHPGVVHVFDAGVSDGEGQGYIVMELVPGRSLAEILRDRGKLAPGEAAELAAEVADALEAIHRHGMVHCDVKPLNIIVSSTGHTKLVDFGIARAAAVDTGGAMARSGENLGSAAEGENLGSAAYVAPEQARGEALDARTDVYALGAVLYEMLVGTRPFSGSTTSRLVSARLVADPPPPRSLNPRISRELEAVVLRALSREPAERYSSAAELREALRETTSRAAAPTQPLKPIAPPAELPHVQVLPPAWLSQADVLRPSWLPRVHALPPAWLFHVHALATAWLPYVLPPSLLRRVRMVLPAPLARVRVAPHSGMAIAAAIAICVLALAGWRVTHPPSNGVPHLVGLRLAEVPRALEESGIPPAEVTVLTRQVQPPYVGTVVDQQPQPGMPRGSDGEVQIAVGVR